MSDRKNKPNFKAVSRAIGLLLLLYNGVLWAVPSDYVVMKWQPQSGLLVTHHQVVDLPDRQFLLTKRPAAQALQLQGHDGQLAWVDLSQAQVIRGEFHGTAHADGWHAELDEFYFVVRAPQGWIKDLIMPGELDRSGWRYDWQQLLAAAESKGPQQPQRGARGGVDNRVNLLFLGDGYLAADEAAFNQHVDDAVAYMQTFEPYRSYRQFLSYDRLFLVSNETGADRPAACYTPASFVDTALDATYCTNSIQRLLTVDSGKVFTAAAAIPNWDQIVVIVNDQEYGGAGGTFSTISTNDLATDVFIHEYGHTFTLLADEYETPYPGYPACSDINGPPCQSNVTDETVRELIKWNEFIAADTPVPTPPTSQYRFVVGLFEGARYLSEDMYRPEYFCNMRTLGTAFCEVCKQSYVFRLYAVPYADGGQLLQLLEPGTASPADPTPTGQVDVPMSFAIETLQTDHGLQVTWLVDDVIVSDVNSTAVLQSYDFTAQENGQYDITVRVADRSPMVHNSRHPELPLFEHSWTVTVQPLADLIYYDGFEGL